MQTHPATVVEQLDRGLSAQANQKRGSWPVRLIGSASEIGDQPQMRLLCAATIAFAIIKRDDRLLTTGIKMLSAHTLATWGKSGVKSVVNRTRPESGDDPRVQLGDSDAHEENSFPSGHSAGAISVAQAFARSYPKHSLTARSAALAVAAVQVPRGTHYAGDVVAGILIGLGAERASEAAIGSSLQRLDAKTINVALTDVGRFVQDRVFKRGK
ncbi:phosphatase PAP2 family protein [Sphingomonas aerophila]|uniref:Phosphatidic acid phosphatase type 2/haloperoxidase domain-containing protein n=1 Tax=Sphingomonas aerophila TaxID=1344948 RepID=A0A7W9EXH9_9SPHN|nr:phosphatase PAP2 family protein [Sphingomonas aerophila]MBB5716842.1 hypothetical protein [Sphingomonas aerophila]